MKLLRRHKGRTLPMILATAVLLSTMPIVPGCSRGDEQPAAAASPQAQPSVAAAPTPAPPPAPAPAPPGPPPGAASAEDLQEMVSPIALYPDVLVAQILAGSTYPTQVVEAERWLKQNPNLTGDQLAAQVNPQPWDPSIKSLTQFPSVLQTMSDNLAWTSALGEAYYNQPADVMAAIQTMRNMAVSAGTLKTTPQQKVEVQPAPAAAQGGGSQPSMQQTVIIQPAQPNTVYVPQYNPTTAYGAPVQAPPGYSGSDLLLTGVLSFGAGMLLGSMINYGHNDWNCGWHGNSSSVKYNNNVYITNNNTYPTRNPSGGYPKPYPPSNGYPGYRPPNGGNQPGYRPPNGNQPGYRPPSGGNRPGNRPPGNGNPSRPEFPSRPGGKPPLNGGGGNNRPSTLPATRPYDPKTARPYEGKKPTKPNFPEAGTLPNNPGAAKPNRKEAQKNRPNQPATQPAAPNRPGTGQPSNRASDPARGYTKDRSSTGGRNSAIGGYEPGGKAQSSSRRGQDSLKGNQGAGGGGNGARGGNANRGGGGGNRGGGGGGGNRGGNKKNK